MAFPEGFVEEVRRAADIVRFISEQVPLKKMGTSWKGLCPFHQEKTPSFNVRSEPPVFHCFGCGEGGDVFKFVMLRERVGFPEALETVARRFGVPIPENRDAPGPDRKEREETLAALEAAALHFSRNLWSAAGAKAREYLLERGFEKATLELIRAGASRDAWDDLFEALKRRFSPQALVKAGLVVEKPERHSHYDRFRNRAMFPILNDAGKVVAFGARSLDGSEPKYLNSPESSVYQKSRTLYGLSWARDAIRKEGRAVLMEGYLDVARALEAGLGEAVATCGTALTSGHARLLRRFTDRAVVNFDQDEAGRKAVLKSLDVLLEEGLRVQVVELPAGHDPDSFVKAEGAAAYRERVATAPEHLDWLIGQAAASHDVSTPSGKAAYLNALLPALVRIESAVERAAWLPRIADRGHLDRRATEQELRRALATRRPVAPAAPTAPPRAVLRPAEKRLLAQVLRGGEGVDAALEEMQEPDLDGLTSADILRAAKALYLRGEAATVEALVAGLTTDEARRWVTEVAVEEVPQANPLECVMELRRLGLQRRLDQIQRDLDGGAAGDAEIALLREKSDLSRQMANL